MGSGRSSARRSRLSAVCVAVAPTSLTSWGRLASARGMAKALKSCCEKTLNLQLKHIRNNYISFPVIKDIPCPVCRQIIPVRVYEKPDEANP